MMLRRIEALRLLHRLYVCTRQTALSQTQQLCERLPVYSGRCLCTNVPEAGSAALDQINTLKTGSQSESDVKSEHGTVESKPSQSTHVVSSPEDTFGNLSIDDQFYEPGRHKAKANVARNSHAEEDSMVKKHAKKGQKKTKKKKSLSNEIEAEEGAAMGVPSRNDEGDTFGLLAEEELDPIEDQRFEHDEMEVDETEQPYRRLSHVDRKHTPTWYGRKIAKLGKQGKVYEALRVYEDEMLKADRVRPDSYVFAELIAVLGRVGYTKKAFSLFNQMKKFGIKPVDPIYTSLFNACAHSPWSDDGLTRAIGLRNLLKESDHQMSLITYRAAVSAFSKCGDIQQAFCIADEAASLRLKQCPKMFSALLMGCISDKEAGFKHAIEVWRLMRRKRIHSDSFLYNLLLRATRECGVGDAQLAAELIQSNKSAKNNPEIPQLKSTHCEQSQHSAEQCMDAGQAEVLPAANVQSQTKNTLKLNSESGKASEGDDNFADSLPDSVGAVSSDNKTESDSNKRWWEYDLKEFIIEENSPSHGDNLPILEQNSTDVTVHTTATQTIPDILNPKESFESIISLGDLTTAESRLGLLGGLDGFLSHMEKDRVKPNIKTFSLLLDVIPPTPEAENALLNAITTWDVKPDIDFMNLLIRKKNFRKDKEGVQEVVELIGEHRMSPNIMTYGCLAMGCHRMYEAKKLFKEMQNAGVTPNTDILTIMVVQSKMDFGYKHYLCEVMRKLDVRPSESLVNSMEHYVKQAWKYLVASERGQEVPDYFKSERFKDDFRIFMKHYKPWLRSMPLEEKAHPWAAYRAPAREEESVLPQDNRQAQA